MPGKKSRNWHRKSGGGAHTPRNNPADRKERDTAKLVNELLETKDVAALRKLAAVRGLPTDGLRRRVWPMLLGLPQDFHDPVTYAGRYSLHHKDSRVVECDMARSLWRWTATDSERESQRGALQRVINAVIASNANSVYYYQGLHDIAGVLLLVCGEPMAFRILNHLASTHLRDCTQPTLSAVVEVLSLIYPLLRYTDPDLHKYVVGLQEPALDVPFFALSWYMTWFAHDVESLQQCARLFDLFIASHPLMPLYLAVASMQANRDTILNCGNDGDLVYSALKGMRILPADCSIDDLACRATELFRRVPPQKLLKLSNMKLRHSAVVHASLLNQCWTVPENRANTSGDVATGIPAVSRPRRHSRPLALLQQQHYKFRRIELVLILLAVAIGVLSILIIRIYMSVEAYK